MSATEPSNQPEVKPNADEDASQDSAPLMASIDPEVLLKILAQPEDQPHCLQEYCPLYESVAWDLSRQYWDARGAGAFSSGDVPFIVNNDGRLSADAALLFVEQLEAAEADGSLEPEWFVLELGAGSGLFAKQFLDVLRRESETRGRDYYQRTTYVLTDGSATMLEHLETSNLLDPHRKRMRMLTLEIPGVGPALEAKLGESPLRVRAVFTNYILDNLPCTILHAKEGQLSQLMVQTLVDQRADHPERYDINKDEIRTILRNGGDKERRRLTDLYLRVLVNTRYDRTDAASLPCPEYLPPALPSDDEDSSLFHHSFAALQCIDEILTLLVPGGFLLISDYGYDAKQPSTDVLEYQQFGGSIATGLNFFQIDQIYTQREGVDLVAPDEEWKNTLTRLIGRQIAPSVQESFKQRFDGPRLVNLTTPVTKAREYIENQQFESARWEYHAALEQQPKNWVLLEEIANFLVYRTQDNSGGLKIAMTGLDINPQAHGLWITLGDALFALQQYEEAESALRKAIAINPREVRGRCNLAQLLIDRGRYDEALVNIGEALGYDRKAEHRDALLLQQSQALEKLSERHKLDLQRHLNRFRSHRNLPK